MQRLTESITGAPSYYHVFSRITGDQNLFGPEEKDHFRSLLSKLAAFSGLEVMTWCCMSNRFHLLVKVPDGQQARALMSEEELFARMELAFEKPFIGVVKRRIERARQENDPAAAQEIIGRLRGQIYALPKFMHMLKRRFSAWYNRRHGRRGTLWSSRYGSDMIENPGTELIPVACSIDLKPVEGGLAKDPRDYPWCGYAEATAGDVHAREAIQEIVSPGEPCEWEDAQDVYRLWLIDCREA